MLKQRIITAIILIAAILGVLFYSPPSVFCVVMGVIALGGTWEWTNLMGIKPASLRLIYVLIMLFVMFNTLFIPITLVLVFSFLWWLLATTLIMLYPRVQGWAKGYLWRGLMGFAVLPPCWVALTYIRSQEQGLSALIFLFVLIWGADSAAYFVGKKWGKTKLASAVSPGKTIQGAAGALGFATLFTLSTLAFSSVSLQVWGWMVLLSVVTVSFSIVGDLFESMLKRQVNLKDSGHLLPGHGGLLDRIDSLTAAAPIFALGALLLGKYL